MDNFDLKKYLTEGRLLKEAVIWNWDGDRNSLEQVPPKFKLAVKAELPRLSNKKFEAAFDAVKNSFADEAGRGSMEFNSDQWADMVKDTTSKGRGLGLLPDYDKGGKYYSENGYEALQKLVNGGEYDLNFLDDEEAEFEGMRVGKYVVGHRGKELTQFISDWLRAYNELKFNN